MSYLFYFLLILIFFEILIRIFIYIKNKKFKFLGPERRNPIKFSYSEHPYIGYCKTPNTRNKRVPSNNYGFAGTKNNEKYKDKNITRIIVCGGSSVEQNDIDQFEPFDPNLTWPKKFEDCINRNDKKYEVLNAGCSGYTIMESLIHFITKGIHFEPNYAILYSNINDAWWVQSLSNFKDDYSHARKHPNFPKKNIIPKWVPNIRFSFLYQYFLIFLERYFDHPNNLEYYYQLNKELHHRYEDIDKTKKVFKDYLKTFCGVCIANNVVPILVPWCFNESLVDDYALYIDSGWDKDKFIKLLKMNNESFIEIANEVDGVKIINVGNLPNDSFRYKDFVHFSKNGLIKMGEIIAKNFLKITQQ